MAGGRPSKFKPEFVEQAAKLGALGATDREIAEFFGVDERTLNRWKHDRPEFCQSLNVGKEPADARVEQSLYRRAIGYTFDSEKVFQFQGAIVRTPVVEHVPPDTTAAIFWLKNRRPNEWRDVHRIEHGGRIELERMADDELADFIRAEAATLDARQGTGGIQASGDSAGVQGKPSRVH
jgi:hypothetical protein